MLNLKLILPTFRQISQDFFAKSKNPTPKVPGRATESENPMPTVPGRLLGTPDSAAQFASSCERSRSPRCPTSGAAPISCRARIASAVRDARASAQPRQRDVRERRLAQFRQNVFGCIGSDFCKKICVLQHFSKSNKIYQILKLNFLKFDKILRDLRHLQFFC